MNPSDQRAPGAEIRLEAVTKSFGSQPVLRGIDLVVRPGSILTVLGGSGTGKSVMLKHMIGLLAPDMGTVRVDGADLTALSRSQLKVVRRKFGYLFQGAAMFDSLTVAQNVAFPLREHTQWSKARVDAVVQERLEELGLQGAEHKYPSEISGGMRKRAALARAIVLEPAVVLYDEPTTGLDPLTKNQVNELIARTHRTHGMTAVVVSHDLPSAFRYSDHIVVLHEGRIASQGRPEEVLEKPHPYLSQLLRAAGLFHPDELVGVKGRPVGDSEER